MTDGFVFTRDNGTINEILVELDKVVDFMRRRRVIRLRLFNSEIELESIAETNTVESSQEPEAVLATPEPNICRCGHDLDTEHNELGCLFGCSEVLCRSEEDDQSE